MTPWAPSALMNHLWRFIVPRMLVQALDPRQGCALKCQHDT